MDEKKKVNFGMKEFKEKLQRATASISPREVKKMIEELSCLLYTSPSPRD